MPDLYQGSELWDLRLVDPDNRRPVDFSNRTAMLEDLKRADAKSTPSLIRRLLKQWSDGRIKLYVIWRALDLRRRHPSLFLDGAYLPIEASGDRAENVPAFARTQGQEYALAIVPRLLARARVPRTEAQLARFWGTTELILPPGFPAQWSNVLTNERIVCDAVGDPCALRLGRVLGGCPLALLFSGSAMGEPDPLKIGS